MNTEANWKSSQWQKLEQFEHKINDAVFSYNCLVTENYDMLNDNKIR